MGDHRFNGAGMDMALKAVGGEADWYSFLMKMLFTAVTLSAGFKGGEIVPTFCIGATFGCVLGSLLGLDPGIAAALGINFFANLLIDATWDYGIFLGATLIYGFLARGFSLGIAFFWGFSKIKDYLKAVTVSFGVGSSIGGATVYDLHKYSSSHKKKLVGIQISYGTTGLYRETAPFDGGLYIPLKKHLSSVLKSSGKNVSKLKQKLKYLKIKISRK